MDTIQEHVLRIDTDRHGPFTFQIGISNPSVRNLLERIDDAHQLFKSSPLSHVTNLLEKEVLVSSIYGTNTIEGGLLTEVETKQALELDPSRIKEEETRRVTNIKAAYDLATQAGKDKNWQLSVGFICDIHAAITNKLIGVERRNVPGVFRDNPKDVITEVGSPATGGRYKPPQFGRDVEKLTAALVAWNNELQHNNVPALVRAPLIHFYFELIHPFWDGNGRVGRVLEAAILLSAGYRYAPFALARFYLDEVHQYFGLFNACRKKAEKKSEAPNTAFVEFHLTGMLTTIKRLHQKVNSLIGYLLFHNRMRALLDDKEINARQYAIVSQLLKNGAPLDPSALRKEPWYIALYEKRGEKTKQRDLMDLRTKELISVDKNGKFWPGLFEPDETEDV